MTKILRRAYFVLLILQIVIAMSSITDLGGTAITIAQTYETHKPIYINGNDEFQQMISSEDWIGTGIEDDPYIIEGLEIEGNIQIDDSSTYGITWTWPYRSLILINHVDSYFEIRDNLLSNAPLGIAVQNSNNGSIISNQISNTVVGVYLNNSNSVSLSQNEISHTIRIGGSPDTALTDLISTSTGGDGIVIENSNLISVNTNFLTNSSIFIEASNHSKIIKNSFFESGVTSSLRGFSYNIEISLNKFQGTNIAMYLNNLMSSIILSNEISAQTGEILLRFYSNRNYIINNTIISSTGNSESGIIVRPNLGAMALGVVDHNYIIGNYIQGGRINLVGNHSSVIGNYILNSSNIGLSAYTSNTTITKNEIKNSAGYGLYLSADSYSESPFSSNVTITANNFISNNQGSTQAFIANSFNPEIEMNYWDDWNTPDSDGDGIVDTPYEILPSEINFDDKPVVSPNSINRDQIVLDAFDQYINPHEDDVSDNPKLGIPNAIYPLSVGFIVIIFSIIPMYLHFNRPTSYLRTYPKIRETINSIMGPISTGTYILLGEETIDDTHINRKFFQKTIPKEIFEYKFLLHPVRLSIMKLLLDSDSFTSTELKETLDISRGDFSFHLTKLEQNGLVTIKEAFVNNNISKMIYITDRGRVQFLLLEELLDRLFKGDIVE